MKLMPLFWLLVGCGSPIIGVMPSETLDTSASDSSPSASDSEAPSGEDSVSSDSESPEDSSLPSSPGEGEPDELDTPVNPVDRLFDNDILEVFLELPPESTDSLIEQSSQAQSQGVEGFDWEYVTADFTFEGIEVENVGVRLKGQGSFQPFWVKPSMKVEFDKFVDDQRFYGLENLTLNNMSNDYTMMHERVGYYVFRELGVPASRAGHVRVYINGEDYGLYTALESVEKEMVERWFDDSGVLYEGWDADFRSGYEYEYELEFGDDDWGRPRIIAAVQALASGSGQTALDAVEPYVDVAQFRHFWAATAVIGQFDAYPYSSPGDDYHIYLDPKTEQFKFIPWGNDESFYDASRSITGVNGIMAQRCLESSECYSAWKADTWEALFAAEEVDWLGYFDEVSAQIYDHVATDTHKIYDTNTVYSYQSSMRTFITSRSEKLVNQIGPPP